MPRHRSDHSELIGLSGIILLTLTLGYISGRIATIQLAAADVPPIRLVPDTRPQVPVVQIDGIRDGKVVGRFSSGARLFINGAIVLPTQSGTFAVPGGKLLTNEITVIVPAGMKFVASKSGKKYYRVDSAGGERIAPQNRVYFPSDEAATAAGYKP